jgi:hypothetical protein
LIAGIYGQFAFVIGVATLKEAAALVCMLSLFMCSNGVSRAKSTSLFPILRMPVPHRKEGREAFFDRQAKRPIISGLNYEGSSFPGVCALNRTQSMKVWLHIVSELSDRLSHS